MYVNVNVHELHVYGSIFVKGANRVTLKSIVLISLFLVKFLFLVIYCCWRIIIKKSAQKICT